LNGPARAAGFSLIEALVTLLVLSIGLLGLGQLQTRLWRGSGDLHATDDAFLLAHNLLETRPLGWFGQAAPSGNGGKALAVQITQSGLPPPFANLTTTRLAVRWQRPSGPKALALTLTWNNRINTRDARWLLPSP
jgi:type II secretory pathway pseudopilin PulG